MGGGTLRYAGAVMIQGQVAVLGQERSGWPPFGFINRGLDDRSEIVREGTSRTRAPEKTCAAKQILAEVASDL